MKPKKTIKLFLKLDISSLPRGALQIPELEPLEQALRQLWTERPPFEQEEALTGTWLSQEGPICSRSTGQRKKMRWDAESQK